MSQEDAAADVEEARAAGRREVILALLSCAKKCSNQHLLPQAQLESEIHWKQIVSDLEVGLYQHHVRVVIFISCVQSQLESEREGFKRDLASSVDDAHETARKEVRRLLTKRLRPCVKSPS